MRVATGSAVWTVKIAGQKQFRAGDPAIPARAFTAYPMF